MLDPLPPPPSSLFNYVKPLADRLNLPSLPYHVHEILGAALTYQFIQTVVSPAFSRTFFKKYYQGFNARTRVNWDVHVVSMVQCCVINVLALWALFMDQERKDMTSWSDRVYGYTGVCGLIQALAAGYFVWDFCCVVRYFRIFGPGLLAHAITALSVYILGFVSVATPILAAAKLTGCAATVLKLLRTSVHTLRALNAVPQHPLVLRQAQPDGIYDPMD